MAVSVDPVRGTHVRKCIDLAYHAVFHPHSGHTLSNIALNALMCRFKTSVGPQTPFGLRTLGVGPRPAVPEHREVGF